MKLFRNQEMKHCLYGCGMVLLAGVAIGAGISLWSAVVVAITGLLMLALFLYVSNKRYDALRQMSKELDEILDGRLDWKLDRYKEGELAILENEVCKMTRRLKEQAESLQGEKQYLADSLADISHQLRTPLTSIHLLVTMLQDPAVTEEKRLEMMYKMHVLLRRIDWLVEALLKISKLDAGTAQLNIREESLKDLVDKSCEMLAISMELHQITLVKEVSADSRFFGDLVWTSEAIMNIVKNCIEHMPEGGKLTITGESNPLYAQIVIRDNGCGIAEEDLPHLFERFYRGKAASDNSVGIGLALARTVIVCQNGTITAKNHQTKEDSGAEFTIRFYVSAV